MENNKYYTPKIEEFYIGFEYEYRGDRIPNPEGWYSTTLKDSDSFGYIKDRLFNYDKPCLRVKYLDKEDIESLGFILKGKAINLWFEREEIYLREDGYHLNNIKLQYGLHDQMLKITFHYVSGETQIHFDGIVKNKSELKKVLKMLSII